MALLKSGGRFKVVRRWVVALGCTAGATATSGKAQEVPRTLERQIKAAYLLNFTRYVDWPAEAFQGPDAPVNICLLGDDPFGEVMDRTVEGRRSRGRPVRVLRPDTPAQARECHVAFLAGSPHEVEQWLEGLRGAPTLAVGDGSEFLGRGGMIGFVTVGETLRFEIAPGAAGRAGLQISSRVLALATRLRDEEEP
jgi:hypothetical protein